MEVWTPEALQENLDAGKSVFLKIWKKGCGACQLSIPATDRLEQNYRDKFSFAKICSDDHPEILEITATDVLPVFFIFKDKKLQGKFLGFKGMAKLDEFIRGNLK